MLLTSMKRGVVRRWHQGRILFSMDAFLEFERELARKKQAKKPLEAPKTFRLEPPIKPKDDECCNSNCPNCILLVYQQQLMEYEDSLRWKSRELTKLTPEPVDISLTFASTSKALNEEKIISKNPLRTECLSVESNQELGTSSVHHIEVHLPQGYATGDNLVVHMFNDNQLIERCAKRLDVDLNTVLKIDKSSNVPELYIDHWITIETLLKWAFDLTSTLRPRLLRILASYATDLTEQQNILTLARNWSQDGDGLNIVDILETYPSITLPFTNFLAIAPLLPARQYSIASSSDCLNDTKKAALAVSTRARGRCAMYLAQESHRIYGYTTPSHFSTKLPLDSTPKVFIGAGTGIAPFRAFISTLSCQKKAVPKVALFQGCRSCESEWLYKEFFQNAFEISTQKNVLEHWFPAFSRDPNEPKKYVQDALLEQYALIGDYIVKEAGTVFICGSIPMGRNVKEALVKCIAKSQQWSHEDAKEYITRMQNEQRLISEVW
ncbi:hypothetical protein THRCLA_02478 [Thraustotheca clavata]|uniref:NADPH--hemoprotein reductase n=1 Tax=Thraustotheca clavata TaxID=74557 RepID=A0A1W0A590_9STRA|nr:hypothetical protein THRCLA_02478 [Thraustotheca clavata]